MPRRILVEKWDIYGTFQIIKEIAPLNTWKEKKRRFIVKCLDCNNSNYEILLQHLRQRNIPNCSLCNKTHRIRTEEQLSKDY